MSKTFPARPTRTAPRGRGRQTTNGRGASNVGVSRNAQSRLGEPNPSEMESHQAQSPGDRVQRREAYTVIQPKADKRQAITEGAQREEENYRQYKEKKKPGAVNYVGTPGGGAITEGQARQRTVNQNKQAAFNVRQKSQQYREETRRKENEVNQKKKSQQREKAEKNERRDSARQRDLKEDHRLKNEAFLRRFEQDTQKKKAEKILNSSAAAALATDADTSISHSNSHGHTMRSSHHDDFESAGAAYCEDTVGLSESGEEDAGYGDPMQTLQQDYPGYSRDVLENLLLQCNGDIDKVRGLIGE